MSEPRECECRQPDCFACEMAGTREWLAAHGLYVVTAAERVVLDAIASAEERDLRYYTFARDGWKREFAEAELARRGLT